jgi:hypothetical protein
VIDTAAIHIRYDAVSPTLDEKGLRFFAASEALAAGRGGIVAVSAVTGIARSTIGRGLKELAAKKKAPPQDRIRRTGGGRKAAVVKQPGLVKALTELIQSALRGDPEADLLWVSKSQRHLAKALAAKGFKVSYKVVGRLLCEMGFSLQANAKTREGGKHPDRNAQFEKINALVKKFQGDGQPAISVDTKKKENVGDFKNAGRTLRPKGDPEPVRVYDFIIKEKVRPRPSVCTTLPLTKAGSMSGSIMIRLLLRLRASGAGGTGLARNVMPTKPNVSLSPPIVAAPTALVCAYGRLSYRSWPMKPVFPSPSPIIRPAPANGTA